MYQSQQINCFTCKKEVKCDCYDRPPEKSLCSYSWCGKSDYPMSFPYSDFISPNPNWMHVCSRECRGKLPNDCLYRYWRKSA